MQRQESQVQSGHPMRCPECEVRNSVAARKCVECGKTLPKRRTPMPFIFGGVAVIGLAGAGLMGIGAAVTVKHDPQSDLAAVAKRFGAGPKNPADAEKLKADLDKAVKEYLKKTGTMSGAQVASALQTALPIQVFEVHVIELPRGLKIVEIDTMLQASNYLVIKNDTDTKVVNIPGLEVCDGAQVVSDPAGPVLIAIGHTAGQGPRKPLVKVYALMPDAIRDQSDKSVPPIRGEGNVSFAKNNKDVNLEVSLYSIGVVEGAFANNAHVAATADDELLKTTFVWDQGKFTGAIPHGKGQLAALHAVARSLKFDEVSPESKPYLSANAQSQIAEFRGLQPSAFTVSKIKSASKRRRAQSSNRFGLVSPGGSFIVELAQSGGKNGGGNWVANTITKTAGEEIQNAQMPGQLKPMPTAMVPSVVRQNINTTSGADNTSSNSASNSSNTSNSSASNTNSSNSSSSNLTKVPAPIVERRGEKQIPVNVQGLKNEPAKIIEKTVGSSKTSGISRTVESRTPVETPKPAETRKPAETQKTAEKQTQHVAETPKAPPKPSGGVAVSRDPSIKDAPAVPVTPGFISNSGDSVIQVRRGPSGAYRTVNRLSRGEQVEIIGRRDGWYKIRVNGREGFVPESSVNSSKPVASAAQESAPPRREAASSSRESNDYSSGSRASRSERRREERRLAREARMAAAREHKPSSSSTSGSGTRTAPHAEEPTNFVP